MSGLGLYWRTLRHLKLAQITGRLRFRLLRPPMPMPVPVPGAHPRALSNWRRPACRPQSLTPPARFTFLNSTQDLNEVGWDAPQLEHLWRYNLHYFDDLAADSAEARREHHERLMARWIRENPGPRGTGWEPYPTSLRIVNWIKWALREERVDVDWQRSLFTQAAWLRRRLEYHLLGNHLFVNAKALLFAGVYCTGSQADEWRRCAQRILFAQLSEQILPDGGQFERTPMYHALALEDVLDLVNLLQAYAARDAQDDELLRQLRQRIPGMLRWLQLMSHPDGTLGMFNDAAEGIAPPAAELLRYAAELGFEAPQPRRQPGIWALRDSGYYQVVAGPATAILDVAPIGPDYLPGHAHADTLSFELSLNAARVVVNGGTSCYGTGERRQFERATASHSTVEVGGVSSSEVWAGFRVGRRARATLHRITADAQLRQWNIEAAHDGYRFLPLSPVHRRAWTFDPAGMLVVDTVSRPELSGIARYLLAPSVHALMLAPDRCQLRIDGRPVALVIVEVGRAYLEAATVTIRFGVLESTQCLAVALVEGRAVARWIWEPDAHSLSD